MNFVIDGIRYHIKYCREEGFPLILLHGFTGDSSTWLPFCNKLTPQAKLIMPDIIGHGCTESPENVNVYQIEKVAYHLLLIMDQLKIKKADILGYSMGGRLALTFAIMFPERIRKLILESASPGLETEAEREQRRLQDGKLADFIKKNGIEEFANYWGEIPLFHTQQYISKHKKSVIRKQRLKNNPIGLANSLLGMGTGSQPSWWDDLKYIQHEVLLVTGMLDKKFCRINERMKKRIPLSQLVSVPNCGHAVHVEDEEKFGTIVNEYLSIE
ncbi:2-succinyl-6-hydroxy-2,4-cyclohexadiene-1-carboxylate synthase [Bacillus aquiflavi]|uniref:Putative 2-succinyl-6-hydroxy-2,4-cyclohexadiene-1-carboxylate synthase n=1 Tax=Bacillus aquiflavi TaxID=2672567 RepID=A0A6B3VXE3_9BACI|nr:2-succinyl-6-hydroxy-2,4-cyclohexadiene-1-carboxylate synthase [Bacillus aquiflavi]MBA4537407.1 2-succinyl-6-hydroxy-2,4-cyclohexadiene-1-carboxylate synthase [Bacillus aquiflavi]NEY81662.1 2-succinyl-6-hydroxy-2,4-cyclohexadiene-1-carboxylate synthase [Bacillus aquiflavi]